MIVQHNMLAENTSRQIGKVTRTNVSSMEKLTTGYRINRAADDAAGLSISEKLRGQIKGLNRASQNITEGIGYVQIADGALGDIHDMLHRIRELAVQSANDTNVPEDRMALDVEVQALKAEIERILEETEYNTIPIWDTETDNKEYVGEETVVSSVKPYSSGSFTVNNTNKAAIAISNSSVMTPAPTYQETGYNITGFDASGAKTTNQDDAVGFRITWTGYDGNSYQSDLVTWEDILQNEDGSMKSPPSYSFSLKDHLKGYKQKDADGNILKDGTGKALWLDDYKQVDGIDFSFSTNWVIEDWLEDPDYIRANGESEKTTYESTRDHFKSAILGKKFNVSDSSSESVSRFANGNNVGSATGLNNGGSRVGVSSMSLSTNYWAELAAGRDAENYDTAWIQAGSDSSNAVGTPNVVFTPGDNPGSAWQLKFNMKNAVGNATTTIPITATLTGASYEPNFTPSTNPSSPTLSEPGKGKFWNYIYETEYVNGNWVTKKDKDGNDVIARDKYGRLRWSGNGPYSLGASLNGIETALDNTTHNLVQDTSRGGRIYLSFTMNADTPFSYGGRTGTNVGSISLSLSIPQFDDITTAKTELEKAVNAAFVSGDTIIDIWEGNNNSKAANGITHSVWASQSQGVVIKKPIYKSIIGRWIQAGANSEQGIVIRYDSLRLKNLGLENTNVLTEQNAQNALNEVDIAESIVAGQRSLFGAYQNRFEHAKAGNDNTSENLQSSESRIRDTDMAKEMVTHAAQEILMQAGQAMLVQTNNMTQGVLNLLH